MNKNPLPVKAWTQGPGGFQHLYFTSASVTADDRWLAVIHEDQDGVALMAIDRNTGTTLPVSNRRSLMHSYVYANGVRGRGFSKSSPILDQGTGRLFWIEDSRVLLRLIGDSSPPQELARLPEGWVTAFNQISPDGRTLVVPVTDPDAFRAEKDQRDQLFQVAPRLVNWGLVTQILLIDTASGDIRTAAEIPFWVTHVQFDPAGSGRILFNSEGSYFMTGEPHIRIWVLEPDGTYHPLFAQSGQEEASHEAFNPDGSLVIYHGHDRSSSAYVAARRLDGSLVWQVPSSGLEPLHAVPTTDGPGVTIDTRDGEIHLGRIQENGATDWQFLCRHDSSLAHQDFHPHPRMNPDGRGVVFTSDSPGRGTVFEVRLSLDQGGE